MYFLPASINDFGSAWIHLYNIETPMLLSCYLGLSQKMINMAAIGEQSQ